MAKTIAKQKLPKDTNQKLKEQEKWITVKSTNQETILEVTNCMCSQKKKVTLDPKSLFLFSLLGD